MIIQNTEISGLILAGGRGSRMGGIDKGLQLHLGVPLAQHALNRLRPQVGALHAQCQSQPAHYRAMGVPVWPDEMPGFPGPLAGMLAGLTHCLTPYLVTVPCDSPNFPSDLVARLAQGLVQANADIATAYTREAGEPRAAAGVLPDEDRAARALARLHRKRRAQDRAVRRAESEHESHIR